VGKFDFECVVVQSRGSFAFLGLGLVCDLDLLDGEFVIAGAVLTELGCEDGEADLALHKVSACDFNKDVLGAVGDLGLLAVNDWG
jgi:hypothetical protein